MTPMQAIKAKCIECSESAREVKLCPVKDCALWNFRTGHNLSGSKVRTEEEKKATYERLAKAREQIGKKQPKST